MFNKVTWWVHGYLCYTNYRWRPGATLNYSLVHRAVRWVDFVWNIHHPLHKTTSRYKCLLVGMTARDTNPCGARTWEPAAACAQKLHVLHRRWNSKSSTVSVKRSTVLWFLLNTIRGKSDSYEITNWDTCLTTYSQQKCFM